MKINILSLVLIILFISRVTAQNQKLVFHHITSEQGLSQNHGLAIFQDYKGFMWFGTHDGLNKYDGKKILVYKSDPRDSAGLSNGVIRSIYEDKEKNLWIGTSDGLNLYNRDKDNFTKFHVSETTTPDLIYAIVGDKTGNLWLASNKGLFSTDKKGKVLNQYLKDIPSTCLYIDSQDNLWVGTRSNGMYLFDRKSKKFKNYPQTRMANIIEDNYGNLWISTWGAGLILFDRKKEAFTTAYKHDLRKPESISKDIIYSTYKDIKGRIWIGTENGGLNLFDPLKGTFEKYVYDVSNKNSISNNSVTAILEDKSGTLWVGVHRGGINYCNPRMDKFQLFQQDPCGNGLSHNNVKAFCEDSEGKIWIATDGGGINVFDPFLYTFKYFRHDPKDPNSVGSDVVLTLFKDRQGTMWIGNYLEGLDKYDKKNNRFIHYKHDPENKNSLSLNNVWNIGEDSNDNLWVGTRDGGLNLLDKKTGRFTRYVFEDGNNKSLPDNLINSIYQDSKKNLWIGTKEGLSLYDPVNNNFSRYDDNTPGSLSNGDVQTIFEDHSGNLWIGTGNGLNLFDRKTGKCKVFDKRNGFPNHVIQAIAEDDQGNLWISSLQGIFRFNYKSNAIRKYTSADGLQGNEFIQNASLKTRDGRMAFGGINGFNFFHPDSVKDNSFEPPVYITGFQLFNKPVKIGADSPLKRQISETDEIILSYKQSIFSFDFAALNYIRPERNQYAYKMEGFDKEWNYIGTQNTTTYTNLNPGKYTFKVKGSTNDGIWNETGASVSIIITPPFWKTLWFKILISLLIIGIAITIYTIRVNTITKQKIALEKQVQERTAELHESNIELKNQKKELALQAQQLQEVNDEIKAQDLLLQNLYTDVKDSIRAAQEIQNNILPSKELIKEYLPEFFIIYRPKDVVSGDFYWFDKIDQKLIFAIGDCTGHGVSGAFMTINGYHLLKNAILKFEDLNPSVILDSLNMEVVEQQRHNHSNSSGMDITLCILDPEKGRLQYAGAKNPLYVIRQKELIQFKADPFSIGQTINGVVRNFTTQDIELLPGDHIYMFTDGFADQLGGPSGDEKFMYSKFRELLINISHEPMEKQFASIEASLNSWMGKVHQLDDILVMGFKYVGDAFAKC